MTPRQHPRDGGHSQTSYHVSLLERLSPPPAHAAIPVQSPWGPPLGSVHADGTPRDMTLYSDSQEHHPIRPLSRPRHRCRVAPRHTMTDSDRPLATNPGECPHCGEHHDDHDNCEDAGGV